MSHALNKVRWCLNKAKRELEQGKKHRGLAERQPSKEIAYSHLAKAEHNLKALIYFEKGGFEDWSISAGFYCLYHCLLAVLAKHGYESRNQECTLAAIERLTEEGKIGIDRKFIDAFKEYRESDERHEETVIELRESLQYGVGMKVESTKLQRLKALCKELINSAKEILPK